MDPNPYLTKLSYSNNDRLVIIHTDDIGMCHASVQAFKDLWAFGTISSGATMVPCPWFPAVAQTCREHPEIDMGVHETLNAEWESYRWGPVSTKDPGSGLIDGSGYFHQWHPAVYENAKPEAVDEEVNAQIEKALTAGIDVTHLDSHMGTIMNLMFIQSYFQAAAKGLLPPLISRDLDMLGLGVDEKPAYMAVMDMYESMGLPLIDRILGLPLDNGKDHVGVAKKLLGGLPVGITHFILHPSIDTLELRTIAPDWPARVANYNAFMSDDLKKFIEREDIRVTGYRMLRDAMRTQC
jgi:predicted glycoside hydrolase/deacetylase ChbG (UPF0249 family)